jgi:hypothetical protein
MLELWLFSIVVILSNEGSYQRKHYQKTGHVDIDIPYCLVAVFCMIIAPVSACLILISIFKK